MTETQNTQTEDRHGKANDVLLQRLKELGWIMDVDKDSDMCENMDSKGKE